MSGRITEELRRMTRAQGRLDLPVDGPPAAPSSPPFRPLLALLVIALVAGVGWLLVRQLTADSKFQDCVMSGRKNCAPVAPGDP